MVILVFYCYTANHHKFSSTNLLAQSSVHQKSEHSMIDFSAQSLTRMKSRGWAGLCSPLEAWLRKNLIPDLFTFLAESCSLGWGSCLPAIDKKLLSTALGVAHIPSPSDLFCLQSQQWRIAFTSNLLLFESPQELLSLFLRSQLTTSGTFIIIKVNLSETLILF